MLTLPTFGEEFIPCHILTLRLGLSDPFGAAGKECICLAAGHIQDTGENVDVYVRHVARAR